METQATPRPWRIYPNVPGSPRIMGENGVVVTALHQANAALIVRAVNNYDALIYHLAQMIDSLSSVAYDGYAGHIEAAADALDAAKAE